MIGHKKLWTITTRAGPGLYYHGAWLEPLGVGAFAGDDGANAILINSYRDSFGRVYRGEDSMLPSAADPNDFQANPLFTRQSLGVGVPILPVLFGSPPEWAASAESPKLRYGLQARPGIFYDTGYLSSGATFYPPSIALNGSQDAHMRGQITFNDLQTGLASVPARFQLDLQTLQFPNLGIGPVQGYFDAILPNSSQLQLRTAMVRALDLGSQGLLSGKAETAFGDIGQAPMLVDSGAVPIGAVTVSQQVKGATVFTGVSQLRYTRYWSNRTVETTGTIEDQSQLTDIVTVPPSTTRLNRWPAFAGRIRLSPTDFDSYQIGALVRPMTFDNDSFKDYTTTGWGVSAITRFCNTEKTDAVYFGSVIGQGIGGYIFGGTVGAIVTTPTSILALRNFGTYAAWQHVWLNSSPTQNLSSNVAYGYVVGDAPRIDDNRELHQAWANLLWNATDKTACGLEYQYGRRQIGSGIHGDDHRIMFVFQVQATTKPPGTEQAKQYNVTDSTGSLSRLRL